jgi:hypothetical protein
MKIKFILFAIFIFIFGSWNLQIVVLIFNLFLQVCK